jgi:hypothetical protein
MSFCVVFTEFTHATGYEKLAASFLARIKLAATRLLLGVYESTL